MNTVNVNRLIISLNPGTRKEVPKRERKGSYSQLQVKEQSITRGMSEPDRKIFEKLSMKIML